MCHLIGPNRERRGARDVCSVCVERERIVYRRAARHNAAVEWRLVRAECYVCAVDVGVGWACVCLCVVGRVCVRFGGSGGVCVCSVCKKEAAGTGTTGRGIRGARCGRTSDDAQSSRSKLMALAAAWRDGFCRSAATASAK